VTVDQDKLAKRERWRNRRIPLLMLGTLVAIIFCSTLLFRAAVLGHVDLPGLLGTRNKGQLISPPVPLAQLPIQLASGETFDYSALPPQWTLVIPVPKHCAQLCQQNLHLTRQIHIALGKDADRVRRFVLTNDYPLDPEFEALLKQHPKLQVLKTDPAAFEQFFTKMGELKPLRDNLYFVVDPQGWVMMVYTPQQDGKAVMTDLKFLLSNSHEQEGKG